MLEQSVTKCDRSDTQAEDNDNSISLVAFQFPVSPTPSCFTELQ